MTKYIKNFNWEAKIPFSTLYIPIFNSAITMVLASGFTYLHSRILLNLGHLNFGISRNNIVLKELNSELLRLVETGENTSNGVSHAFLSDYFKWVHFRSLFIMIDLVNLYPRKYFNDKTEYDRIKKAIQE